MASAIFALMMAAQTIVGGVVAGESARVPPEVAARRDAMRAVAANVNRSQENLLPQIEAGLRDADAQVRFSAISALTTLNMRVARMRPGDAGTIDPHGSVPLRDALLPLLDDDDFRIRGGAIKALGVVENRLSPAVRAALGALYERESNPGVRTAIVEDVGADAADSPEAQNFILQALSDPSPDVRRRAAMAVPRFRSPAALTRIVAELQSGIADTRAEFVFALASYGPLARPHVAVLKGLLASEFREGVRAQIQQAIGSIERPGN